ncbi:hypothetical protein Tco_1489412, partial [Tanacetum coccineum]
FQAPPSPDYVSGPEYPPSPEFVQEPVYPEFMPPENEILPAEEQPLPAAISPTTDSPGYVPESDPEEDPEEDDDEDPEEDLVDYPADGEDEGDDEDESSDDDEDDDDVDVEDDEEEEHPDPADSTAVALPAVDHAPSVEETESFETDESAATPLPHPVYRVTDKISIRYEPPTPFWSDTEVARLIAIPTSPPSPLSPWSSPLPQSRCLRGYIAASEEVVYCYSPRYKVGESSSAPAARQTGGFTADYGFVATLDDECRRDPDRYVGYRITDTWDEMLVDMPGAPATDDIELSRRMTEFSTKVKQDTDEICVRQNEAQDDRLLMSGRLNTLFRDRRNHARTSLVMKREARLSREAWGQSMDVSDTARSEVMALRTQVIAQQAEIVGLRAANRTR